MSVVEAVLIPKSARAQSAISNVKRAKILFTCSRDALDKTNVPRKAELKNVNSESA
jgi:predicted neuraminidase